MAKSSEIIPIERIQNSIYLIRKQKVMLDRDLAQLYGVQTRALVQAVKRNIKRFPSDFMFQLTKKEKQELITNFEEILSLKCSPSLAAFSWSAVNYSFRCFGEKAAQPDLCNSHW